MWLTLSSAKQWKIKMNSPLKQQKMKRIMSTVTRGEIRPPNSNNVWMKIALELRRTKKPEYVDHHPLSENRQEHKIFSLTSNRQQYYKYY